MTIKVKTSTPRRKAQVSASSVKVPKVAQNALQRNIRGAFPSASRRLK